MQNGEEFVGPDLNDGYGYGKDGKSFVVIGQKQARPPTLESTPSEAVNLASRFTDAERKNMGQHVWDRYVGDVKSRGPRMKKIKEFLELYASLMRAKSMPFQHAANINLPLLTYPMLQVQARLFDMMWPENGKVLYSAPSDVGDMERATATEKFGNSYMRHNMSEMEQGIDDTLAQMTCSGSAFRRTYWDPYEGRVRSDWIPIEDFVAPNWHRSQDPSMRDVPRYTLVHHLTIADLEEYGDKGIFENVDGLKAGEDAEQPPGVEVTDTAKRLDGTGDAGDDMDFDKPRMVLEQHCRWRLPDRVGKHPAFDGKWHYVIITVDEASKRVLRVVLREEDDPKDLKRYQKEKSLFDQYTTAMRGYDDDMKRFGQFLTVASNLGRPIPDDLQLPTRPPPHPELRRDKTGAPVAPEPVRKRQIVFFTHYRAFWSEGFYGLGFGDFLAPLAKAANALLNQHLDGVTLRNSKPGFISRSLRGARGPINSQPGKLTEVDAPPSALRDGIVWMEPPQNDPTTMPLIRLVLEIAEKLSGSADLMSGSTSGSNRTAKEIQILNSQLMKQISVLARRVKGAFKHELDKIWRCWGVFLPEEPEDTPVVDPATGQPETIPISRKMFIPDARVMPAADPRMRFEKIEEANNKMGIVQNNPLTQNNPMAMFIATEEVLRANDGDRILSALQPPQPPQPPQPKQHWEEEADWLRNEDPPVHPEDNDAVHSQGHRMFFGSPQAMMMTKEQREKAEQHLRNHEAAGILKSRQGQQMQMHAGGPPPGMPPGPPRPPMGPPPGGPPPGPPPGLAQMLGPQGGPDGL